MAALFGPSRWYARTSGPCRLIAGGLLMLSLVGCGADGDLSGNDSGAAASSAQPTESGPPYRLEIGEKESTLRVFIDETYPAADMELIVADLQRKYADRPDGYFVTINCSVGGTRDVDNRLANAKFAVGSIGAARTGLEDGQREFEPVQTPRKCPPEPLPAAAPTALTAQHVVDAFIADGLPARDPRDNTMNGICADLDCVQLITTDDVSVYQFADPESAERWAQGIGESGYLNGPIFLRFNTGGSDPTDPAAIPQYKAVLDGLVG